MTAFRCLVVAPNGKPNWREVDAADAGAAVARLVAEGVTPIDVRSGRTTLVERLNQPVTIGRRLRLGEQALLLTQLATLLKSGLPVDRSLDLLREQATRGTQRNLLARVVARVREGGSLAAGLESIGSFPPYVIGVLRSAERSGGLSEAMASVAERLNTASITRGQLITALTYPLAVLAATGLALVLVLTTVVPQFAAIFEGQEARLPTLTRLVLALSALVVGHGLTLAASLVAGIAIVILGVRTLRATGQWAQWRRRLPGISLADQYLAAQFLGVFATLIGNGVTVVGALPLAGGGVGGKRWRDGAAEVERRVREGSRLSIALARSGLIPVTAVRLIEVGELGGKLAATCDQASVILARAAKARIDRIVALANPVAILILGGLVGSLVAGVMLGIFSLGDFTG